jgi:hypothetical protein
MHKFKILLYQCSRRKRQIKLNKFQFNLFKFPIFKEFKFNIYQSLKRQNQILKVPFSKLVTVAKIN